VTVIGLPGALPQKALLFIEQEIFPDYDGDIAVHKNKAVAVDVQKPRVYIST